MTGSQSHLDELLGVLGHVGPLWLGELVLAGPDPLLHARRDGEAVVGVEGRETAQSEYKTVNSENCQVVMVGSEETYRMYMMTPRDQISQDLSYFSGPNTSGAAREKKTFSACKKLQ